MFTRLTVSGTINRATLLVPDDEPLGESVTDIARLLHEPPSPVGLTLVGRLGEELDLEMTPAGLELVDGAGLRLVARDEAPPPPEVSDVTQVVAEVHDANHGRWDERHRLAGGGIVLGVVAALLVSLLPDSSKLWVPFVYAVLAAVSWPVGRYVGAWAGIACVALAIGCVPVTTVFVAAWLGSDAAGTVLAFLAGFASPDGRDALGSLVVPPPVELTGAFILQLLTAFALVWVPLGAGGAGVTRRGAPAFGAATALVLSIAGVGLLVFGLPVDRVMALCAVLVVVGVGAVPLVALEVSRLASLDDLVIAGHPADRAVVQERAATAFATMTWCVCALAFVAMLAAARLFVAGGVWPTLIGVVLVLLLVLRTRVVPLAVQVWSLWSAGLAAVLFACLRADWPGWVVLVVALSLVVGTICGMRLRPRAHTRVRLRRVGDALEFVVVLALVPCVLGVFGVYPLALEVF